MILPKKDKQQENSKCVKSITAGFNKQIGLDQVPKSNNNKSERIKTTSLDFNLTFVCTGEDFYNALTKNEVSFSEHIPETTNVGDHDLNWVLEVLI